MALPIRLDIFEGPFDLLCHLLDENKVDIYDIPIAEIADQYLACLDSMREFDLEVASEFVVLAATLIAIKARMLLPREKNDQSGELPEEFGGEDPRADLVRQILEYKKYKELAQSFSTLAEARSQKVARPNEEQYYVALLGGDDVFREFSPSRLQTAMDGVLSRLSHKGQVHMVGRENVTVKDQIRLIEARLLAERQGFRFADLYGRDVSRLRVIIIFLALLELIKQRRLLVVQQVNGGEIYIYPPDALQKVEQE